jgi:hypothetical protein
METAGMPMDHFYQDPAKVSLSCPRAGHIFDRKAGKNSPVRERRT